MLRTIPLSPLSSPTLTYKRKPFQGTPSRVLKCRSFLKEPFSLDHTKARSHVNINPCNSPEEKSVVPPVIVCVSPGSPQSLKDEPAYNSPCQSTHLNVSSSKNASWLTSPDTTSEPVHSPQCLHPSPSNGFLYTPDRKVRYLGRGAFGNVTFCKYKNHKFALKVICHSSQTLDVGESNLLGVHHTHLVRILNVIKDTTKTIICMEYAGHLNLQQVLDMNDNIALSQKISFSYQIASGLQHCHKKGILHCDVKPSNVIVNPLGVCKLGDFGLSTKIVSKVENPAPIMGTAAYISPEILRGRQSSPAADVYSLGVTLWQIFTRCIPFVGKHPHVIIYQVVSQNKRPSYDKLQDSYEMEYANISKLCWIKETKARPSCEEVAHMLKLLYISKKKNHIN